MISDRPLSRRRFLQSGLAAASAARLAGSAAYGQADGGSRSMGPGVPDAPPDARDQNILVVVHLVGGNDGLNTVVPYGSRDYERARPRIRVEERHALKIRGSEVLGLHPELTVVKELMEEGWAGIVQGVGYPYPQKSHATSTRIWHTANLDASRAPDAPDAPGGPATSQEDNGNSAPEVGWIGSAMDAWIARGAAGADEGLLGVCVGTQGRLAMVGRDVWPLVIQDPKACEWSGSQLSSILGDSYEQVLEVSSPLGGGPGTLPGGRPGYYRDPVAHVLQTAADLRVLGPKIRQSASRRPLTAFPGGRLADQLTTVAGLIRHGWPTRVYWVELDGFDTHVHQPDPHAESLYQLAVGVQGFSDEMHAAGLAHRVTLMAFSEFGRRVEENGSVGTDHGTAGPVFFFGPAVEPGLLGAHPSLSDLDNGDLIPTVDFRTVYATVLEQWLGIDSVQVLGDTYKPLKLFKSVRG